MTLRTHIACAGMQVLRRALEPLWPWLQCQNTSSEVIGDQGLLQMPVCVSIHVTCLSFKRRSCLCALGDTLYITYIDVHTCVCVYAVALGGSIP